MTEWQPIETAPEKKAVLTNQGTGIYSGQWYICEANGRVPACADWGVEVSEIEPTHWMPLPDPPSNPQA
jgi:hypothetical protein